jgi:hypothetical protein
MLSDWNTICSIFGVVKAFNDTERKASKEFSKKAQFRGERMLAWLPSLSVLAAVIFLVVNNLLKVQLLLKISLVFLLISYLALLVSEAILAFRNLWNSRKFFRDPVGSLLDSATRQTEMVTPNVNTLYKYESEDLRYVLVQLKAARAALEKRTSLLVGAIEKVGIFGMIPGLIALFKAMHELTSGFPSAGWVQGVAYATPFAYGIGLMSHGCMTTFDRYIMLIEMVIENKKSITSEEPSATLTNGLAPSIAGLKDQ